MSIYDQYSNEKVQKVIDEQYKRLGSNPFDASARALIKYLERMLWNRAFMAKPPGLT